MNVVARDPTMLRENPSNAQKCANEAQKWRAEDLRVAEELKDREGKFPQHPEGSPMYTSSWFAIAV